VITPSLGNDIQAQIIDVTETDIVYKNWNSPDGPTLTMLKSDVLIISYADGKKEVLFKQIEKNKTPKSKESVNTDTKIAIINLAPDQITLKSGVDIQANVIAVNDTAIVYTLFNSVDESTVSISTDRVLLIRYADGTKELIYKTKQKKQCGN
jgi:sarcosine oxidase gamma subunit